MRVFVTGGSGFVGGHVITALVERGDEVRALARSDQARDRVAELGAAPVSGGLDSIEVLAGGMTGAELVIHAAAITRQWGERGEFWATNVTGTRNVIDACGSQGVSRLVHVSTEAVLMSGGPLRSVDETEPYPDKFVGIYAETKARAEQLVLAAGGGNLETVAVRPRFIWGPGDNTLVPTIKAKIQSGAFRWINNGADLTSTCHVTNCVAGILLAAEHGLSSQTYFLSDGDPVTYRELITDLMTTQGVVTPEKSAPAWLVRSAAASMEGAWRTLRLNGAPPLTRSEVALAGQEVTVDDTKARRQLEYDTAITRAAGMAELTEGR